MSGSKEEPLGTCFMMRSLYATAKAAVVTGGTRFGMQIALLNVRAANGTVVANAAPSLKWWCQSSGLASVRVWSCSAILQESDRSGGAGSSSDRSVGEGGGSDPQRSRGATASVSCATTRSLRASNQT